MISVNSNANDASMRLKHMVVDINRSLDEGLTEAVLFGHREVLKSLSGKASAPAGSDPVPVRTGHLRRSENYITPGQSKVGMTAGSGQAMLVNTANYASNIHEGTGPHAVFGPRPFMRDAADKIRERLPKTMIVAMRRNLAT